jgi:hypothetical protein
MDVWVEAVGDEEAGSGIKRQNVTIALELGRLRNGGRRSEDGSSSVKRKKARL